MVVGAGAGDGRACWVLVLVLVVLRACSSGSSLWRNTRKLVLLTRLNTATKANSGDNSICRNTPKRVFLIQEASTSMMICKTGQVSRK